MTDNAGYAPRREREKRAIERFELMLELVIMVMVSAGAFCAGMAYATFW